MMMKMMMEMMMIMIIMKIMMMMMMMMMMMKDMRVKNKRTYICSVIQPTLAVHKLLVVRLVSWIVQVTVVCFRLIIDTDAVRFIVTKQFTNIHIRNPISSDCVVHQTLVSEEWKTWEYQYTAFTWKRQVIAYLRGPITECLPWDFLRTLAMQLFLLKSHQRAMMCSSN